MPRGEKFTGLTGYLEKCGKDEIKMSFSDIEKILGFRLKDSAYVHEPYWSNTKSHSIAYGWLNAGYRSQHVDMAEQTIEFVKETRESRQNERPAGKMAGVPNMLRTTLDPDEAVRCIRTYFNETVKDPHGRYLSWRHCYNAFIEYRNNADEKMIDYLALNLAFYLASWGMYRGSTFLLQKDYKVHIPVVKILIEEKYNPLLGISAEGLTEDSNLELLDNVSSRIIKAYAAEQPPSERTVNKASETLVTKILLGTLGCVPAYDKYYKETVKQYNISAGAYNKNSVRDVALYYLSYKDEFESLREELSTCGTRYPAMKLMDMCMWQLAFESDKKKKL